MESTNSETDVKPRIVDPKLLITSFRTSTPYAIAYSKFYAGKMPAIDVTEDEKREAFERDDAVKEAFYDYTHHEIIFHYNTSFYSPEAQRAIQDHDNTIKDYREMQKDGASQNQLLSLDSKRVGYHEEAASILVRDAIAPTQKLGKALVNLVSIEKGLESYGNAREPDAKRIQRVIGGPRR